VRLHRDPQLPAPLALRGRPPPAADPADPDVFCFWAEYDPDYFRARLVFPGLRGGLWLACLAPPHSSPLCPVVAARSRLAAQLDTDAQAPAFVWRCPGPGDDLAIPQEYLVSWRDASFDCTAAASCVWPAASRQRAAPGRA